MNNSKILEQNKSNRIILDKPFGTDAKDARELNAKIDELGISRAQILLVDHFLAYPGMRQLLATRHDPVVDAALNHRFVKKVDVVMEERILSNDRKYFRETGIVEDMMQNHGMQLLATAVMSLPHNGREYRQARREVIESVQLRPESFRKAQFEGFNEVSSGAPAGAEPSSAETYAHFKFDLDQTRWQGVDFSMTAVKGATQKRFGVDFQMKELPPELAQKFGLPPQTTGVLQFDVRPEAAIRFISEGGTVVELEGTPGLNDKPPYSRLLADAMKNEEGLFVEPAESLAAWKVVEELQQQAVPLESYPVGTRGPGHGDSFCSVSR